MTPRKPRKPMHERFWEKVDQSGGPDSCWLWVSQVDRRGYGKFTVGGRADRKVVYAHRLAYELTHGPIPDGLHGLHRCDTPSCVNPAHIFLGTHADNMRDMTAKRRHWAHSWTHCKAGHEFSPENTRNYVNPKTGHQQRVCIECKRLDDRKRRGATSGEDPSARAAIRRAS